MKCRYCKSTETRTTVTEHHDNETWRYCRCLKCDARFKTIETYAIKKRGAKPNTIIHPNQIKRGEYNPSSVLTEDNIKLIRDLASQNKTYKWIAKKFGISLSTVYRIVNRKLWSHV
jgi:transcriptional regulator NrdR family protein